MWRRAAEHPSAFETPANKGVIFDAALHHITEYQPTPAADSCEQRENPKNEICIVWQDGAQIFLGSVTSAFFCDPQKRTLRNDVNASKSCVCCKLQRLARHEYFGGCHLGSLSRKRTATKTADISRMHSMVMPCYRQHRGAGAWHKARNPCVQFVLLPRTLAKQTRFDRSESVTSPPLSFFKTSRVVS